MIYIRDRGVLSEYTVSNPAERGAIVGQNPSVDSKDGFDEEIVRRTKGTPIES